MEMPREWAPRKNRLPLSQRWKTSRKSMAPGSGRFGADAFTLQEDGKLCCPAGASLWLSEGEHAATEGSDPYTGCF